MIMKKYPKIGIPYYHYKGGVYEVITLGKDSENGEDVVVYKSTLFGSVYVRPLSMWFEDVDYLAECIENPKDIEYAENKKTYVTRPRFSDNPDVYKIKIVD